MRDPVPHMAGRESGGRRRRQPGQIRKEAATTISRRVVPAPTFPSSPIRASREFCWNRFSPAGRGS